LSTYAFGVNALPVEDQMVVVGERVVAPHNIGVVIAVEIGD
jgi:hypothetical protein